jgi:hypothetical protein
MISMPARTALLENSSAKGTCAEIVLVTVPEIVRDKINLTDVINYLKQTKSHFLDGSPEG